MGRELLDSSTSYLMQVCVYPLLSVGLQYVSLNILEDNGFPRCPGYVLCFLWVNCSPKAHMDIAKARKCPNSFSSTDCSPDISVLKSTLIASSSSQPTGRVFPNKRDRETWEKVMAQQHYFTICLDIYWETCRLRPVASAQDLSANKIPKLRSQCCLCLTAEQHLPQHRRGEKNLDWCWPSQGLCCFCLKSPEGSSVLGDWSPGQQSPALGFKDCMEPAAAVCWHWENNAEGNAIKPKSRENGSRNVFITAAATILGTERAADITGGWLYHQPGWAAGWDQLRQSSSWSVCRHTTMSLQACSAAKSCSQHSRHLSYCWTWITHTQKSWENKLAGSK